jgi:hypothetical protein
MEMNWVMAGEKHQKGKDCTAMCGINAEGLHLQSGTIGENVPDQPNVPNYSINY